MLSLSPLQKTRFLALLAVLALAAACGDDAVAGGDAAAADATDAVAVPDVSQDADARVDTDAVPVPDTVSDTGTVPDAVPDVTPTDYPPGAEALIPLDGQMLLSAGLGADETGWLVVDTGAVRTAVEETVLREVENGVGYVDLDLGGGVVFADYEVIAADLSKAIDHIGHPIAGLVGQDLFAAAWFGLDYRAARVHVAAEAPVDPPPGFAEDDRVALPYDLVQGLPIVTAQVGGEGARLIADTGSGVTLLVESLVPPDVLAAGLTGYVWHTSYGSDPATIVRLPSLSIAGQEVRDTWVVVVPDDFHLKPVFDSIGVDVQGFLGYPVYRRFFLEVHGADHRYDLFPYDTLPHVPDGEWDRVGVEIRRDSAEPGAPVVVDMVFAPSDAADEDVRPEDVLVAIDDTSVAGVPLDDVRRLLRGAPGETRQLSLEREGVPLEVTVEVERLLP